jgi:four helix bundle protein
MQAWQRLNGKGFEEKAENCYSINVSHLINPLFMPFKFERLNVWQKSLELSDSIHQLTKNFPKEELYVLTSQVKRAADSIGLNIAEGSTGQSDAEYSKFIGYAIRSDIEVVACLHIATRREYLDRKAFDELYRKCEVILYMLYALRNKIKSSVPGPRSSD